MRVGLVALKGKETAHEVGQDTGNIRFIRPTRAGCLRAIRGAGGPGHGFNQGEREDGRKKRRGWAMGNGRLLHVGACGSNPDQEIRTLALSYLPPTPPLPPLHSSLASSYLPFLCHLCVFCYIFNMAWNLTDFGPMICLILLEKK